MPFAQTSRRLRAVAYTTGKAFQLADYFSNLLIEENDDQEPANASNPHPQIQREARDQ